MTSLEAGVVGCVVAGIAAEVAARIAGGEASLVVELQWGQVPLRGGLVRIEWGGIQGITGNVSPLEGLSSVWHSSRGGARSE